MLFFIIKFSSLFSLLQLHALRSFISLKFNTLRYYLILLQLLYLFFFYNYFTFYGMCFLTDMRFFITHCDFYFMNDDIITSNMVL